LTNLHYLCYRKRKMSKITDLDKFYLELGENIKNLRVKRGYNQEELAIFLDLTRTSVVNIEKGRQRPPIHTLYEIANFLNVHMSELFPSADEKKQIDLLKEMKKTIDEAEKKFKDVPIDQEKLSHFFQLSNKD
jgi:transcriptional regulator with XRE-family HTH domain